MTDACHIISSSLSEMIAPSSPIKMGTRNVPCDLFNQFCEITGTVFLLRLVRKDVGQHII